MESLYERLDEAILKKSKKENALLEDVVCDVFRFICEEFEKRFPLNMIAEEEVKPFNDLFNERLQAKLSDSDMNFEDEIDLGVFEVDGSPLEYLDCIYKGIGDKSRLYIRKIYYDGNISGDLAYIEAYFVEAIKWKVGGPWTKGSGTIARVIYTYRFEFSEYSDSVLSFNNDVRGSRIFDFTESFIFFRKFIENQKKHEETQMNFTRCPYLTGKRVEYAKFLMEIDPSTEVKILCQKIIDLEEDISNEIAYNEKQDRRYIHSKEVKDMAKEQHDCYLKIKELSWYYK